MDGGLTAIGMVACRLLGRSRSLRHSGTQATRALEPAALNPIERPPALCSADPRVFLRLPLAPSGSLALFLPFLSALLLLVYLFVPYP